MDVLMTEFKDEAATGRRDTENEDLPKKVTPKKKTSKFGTLLHLIKAHVGPGILALPNAISNAGLVVGTVGLIFLGLICIYCMNVVVGCSKIIASKMNEEEKEKKLQKSFMESTGNKYCSIISDDIKRKNSQNIEEGEFRMSNEANSLDYATTAEMAFRFGPTRCKKLAPFIRFSVNAMLVLTQFGFCCVYFIFIAESLHEVFAHLQVFPFLNAFHIMLLELPFMILLNLIPNLSTLTCVTTTAIVLQSAGLASMFFYFLTGEKSETVTPYLAPIGSLPLYFGTAMYAFEGIGVVLPLENEMKRKKDFRGWTGVLNVGMCIVAFLFTAVGVCGYLKYGSDIRPSVTFNLPSGWFSELIRLVFALAVLLTYPLQMYVPFTFTLPYLRKKLIRDSYKSWIKHIIESVIRASFVIFTFAIASAVPMLDLIISFSGAFASSGLALILPPIIHILTIWESDIRYKKLIIAFDAFICLFGMFGLLLGSGTAILEMWKIYSYTNTSSHYQNVIFNITSGVS